MNGKLYKPRTYNKFNMVNGKLYKPRTYNTVRASYFSIRVIKVWNSLPADCVDFSSFASFKRTVKQIDFTPFLLCYHVWLKHNSHLYIVYYY